MDNNEEMNKKERFDLLYKSLAEGGKGFVENAMQTTAFLIIVIGWLLTSEQTRVFLGTNKIVKWISLVVIIAIDVVHTLTCIGLYVRAKKKSELLSNLNYVETEYYNHHKISLPHLSIVLLMNTSLFVLIFMIVLIGTP